MEKNFLISTGGSGGHVVPAIILHEHLSKEFNVFISTDERGLKYLERKNYKYKIINTPRLDNIFFFPINLIFIFILTFKSIFLLKKEKIKNVFSTGGYMSLPVILASRILGSKIYLIEPNLVLGRANRYFLPSCVKIFCYTDELKNFPKNHRNKIIKINPLVKKNIYASKSLTQKKKEFTLLVVGGSQGANIFDKNLKNFIINISKNYSIRVIQQTSENNIYNLKEFYLKNEIENEIFSFKQDFESIIQNVDLCITRAGASTLAELSVANIPFIAVPLPTAKDNHQYENANFYMKKNCCWLIEQKNFELQIEDVLKSIINNKKVLLEKKKNLEKLNYQNSWNDVNQKLQKIIYEN